jgi:tetratricopeptide (TPR) repeat protein
VEELWSGRGVNWAVEMAEDLRAQGLPREAYGLLERTLTNLERAGQVSPYVLSVMHRELGLAERSHDPVIAEKHLRQAAELALEHQGPVVETAQAFAGLGDVLADQGDLDGSLTAYRQATSLLLDHYPVRR